MVEETSVPYDGGSKLTMRSSRYREERYKKANASTSDEIRRVASKERKLMLL